MLNKKIPYDSNVAITYNRDREHEEHWLAENEYISKYFTQKNTNTILDIPIGTGRFLKYYPNTSKIYGIDISSDMLSEAKKEAAELKKINIQFEIGDAANLSSTPNDSIDTIVCCRLLHLVNTNERIRFLQEFSRILKGELILQLYIDKPKKSILHRMLIKAIRALKKLSSPSQKNTSPWSHIKSYGLSELELCNILKSANMQIVKRSTICSYHDSNVVMLVLRNN